MCVWEIKPWPICKEMLLHMMLGDKHTGNAELVRSAV